MPKLKKRGPKFKKRRSVDRAQLFPKKTAKENMAWDIVYHRMRMSIEAAFPDPDERLRYMVNLMKGLEDDSEKSNQ